jgi:UDP-2,3-diacylglucosamine pyrophosphatase LpxH
MEFQLNQKSLLIAALVLSVTACGKIEGPTSSSEPVDKRFRESMEWNLKHPYTEINVESDDYSILTIADVHVGGTTNLDRFLNTALNEKPAAVIIDGDLNGGKVDDYDIFEKHFPKNDSLRSFYLAGNHDLWHNGWEEFYKRYGSSSYYFTVKTPSGTDLFICLDTGGGTLGKLQTEWLTDILQTMRSSCSRCVVITHINMFRPRKTESTNLVEEELVFLMDLFARNNVDMVITGHDHEKDVETFGVTTYIVVDALEDGLSNAGYMNMRVKKGEIGYEFVNIND